MTNNAADPHTETGNFDGWSFFGGIILTLALSIGGLVGYQYYRVKRGSGPARLRSTSGEGGGSGDNGFLDRDYVCVF